MKVEIGNVPISWWKIRIPRLFKMYDVEQITGNVSVVRNQLMRLGLKPRLEQLFKELVVFDGETPHITDAQRAAKVWFYLDPQALRRLGLLPRDTMEQYDGRFIPPTEVASALLAMYDQEAAHLQGGGYPSEYLLFLAAQPDAVRAAYWRALGDARKVTLVADYLATSNFRLSLEQQFGDLIKEESIEFIANLFDLIIDGQNGVGGVATRIHEFSWLFFDLFCTYEVEELMPLARKIAAVWPQSNTPWTQAAQVRRDITSIACGTDRTSDLIRCLMVNGYSRLLYDQEKGSQLLRELYCEGRLSFRITYAALRDTGKDGQELAHRFCLECLSLEGENREERQAAMLKEAVLIDCELSNPTVVEYRNLAWASQLLFRALAVEYAPGCHVSPAVLREAVRGVMNAYDEAALEFRLVGEFLCDLSTDAMRELTKQAIISTPYEFQDYLGALIMSH